MPRVFPDVAVNVDDHVASSTACSNEIEQPIHFPARFLVEHVAHRPADDRVLKDALLHQQIFFDREERVEAVLHGDERGDRQGELVGTSLVRRCRAPPERDDAVDQIRARHGADDPAAMAIDQRDPAGPLEDLGPSSGPVAKGAEPRADRSGLGLEEYAVGAEFLQQPGLHGDRHGPADVAAGVLDDERDCRRADDPLVVAEQFVLADTDRDRRDGHRRRGAARFGVAGKALGRLRALGADAE